MHLAQYVALHHVAMTSTIIPCIGGERVPKIEHVLLPEAHLDVVGLAVDAALRMKRERRHDLPVVRERDQVPGRDPRQYFVLG